MARTASQNTKILSPKFRAKRDFTGEFFGKHLRWHDFLNIKHTCRRFYYDTQRGFHWNILLFNVRLVFARLF